MRKRRRYSLLHGQIISMQRAFWSNTALTFEVKIVKVSRTRLRTRSIDNEDSSFRPNSLRLHSGSRRMVRIEEIRRRNARTSSSLQIQRHPNIDVHCLVKIEPLRCSTGVESEHLSATFISEINARTQSNGERGVSIATVATAMSESEEWRREDRWIHLVCACETVRVMVFSFVLSFSNDDALFLYEWSKLHTSD